MTFSFSRLRNAAAQCQAAGGEDAALLGKAVISYLDARERGDDITLEQAFGFDQSRLLAYRDERIRESHRLYFGNLRLTPASRQVVKVARRVEAKVKAGQIAFEGAELLIYEALQTGIDFPKERQVFNILSMQ